MNAFSSYSRSLFLLIIIKLNETLDEVEQSIEAREAMMLLFGGLCSLWRMDALSQCPAAMGQ
eukprot:2818929-Pleurochrysis_carterae.AAC.1